MEVNFFLTGTDSNYSESRLIDHFPYLINNKQNIIPDAHFFVLLQPPALLLSPLPALKA